MEFRNETEILLEMVARAEEQNLITTNNELITSIRDGKRTENQYVLDLATHAYILSQLEMENKEIHDNCNIATATGQALDNMGLLVNVARSPATPAMVTVNLSSVVNEAEDITIPYGTRVVLRQDMSYYGEYVLSETVTIPSGVANVTTTAENTVYGVMTPLPVGAVVGVLGYNVLATNVEKGTTGRNIEEDDDYRLRIMGWASKNRLGTRACVEDYLNHYTGVGEYHLVPQFDGTGSLKIVCDTLESLTDQISSDVYENCLDFTDTPPLVVLPDDVVIERLKVVITTGAALNISSGELQSLVGGQVHVFVEGGTSRNGRNISGQGIGADFNPSSLIKYLLDEFPELDNLYLERWDNTLTTPAYVPFNTSLVVDDTCKLQVYETLVVFEG